MFLKLYVFADTVLAHYIDETEPEQVRDGMQV